MRHLRLFSVLGCFCASLCLGQSATPTTPEPALTPQWVAQTVTSLQALIKENYYNEALIPTLHDTLQRNLEQGAYSHAKTLADLAQRLTDTIYGITHDKHFSVIVTKAPKADLENVFLDRKEEARVTNFGIPDAEVLEGNVGYLKITGFLHPEEGESAALKAAMGFLSHTDAMILDMRGNSGGSPSMAVELISYFFNKPDMPLFTVVRRAAPPVSYSTLGDGFAGRNERRPLYVLVSSTSGSGGEGVPYVLQQMHRAVIIGEKTWGGANPSGWWPVNSSLTAIIPFGQVRVEPHGTNWEGVGVLPDIQVPADEALKTAYALALRNLIATTTDPAEKQMRERILNRSAQVLNHR